MSGAAAPSKKSFAVSGGGAAHGAAATARAGVTAGVGSLDALLALQQLEGPLERRKRSVRRAGRILDELDGMKLALLAEGPDTPDALARLQTAVRDERARTDDAGLEAVLDEVELRAAVELAKREPRPTVTSSG